jgi:hypothetical protein
MTSRSRSGGVRRIGLATASTTASVSSSCAAPHSGPRTPHRLPRRFGQTRPSPRPLESDRSWGRVRHASPSTKRPNQAHGTYFTPRIHPLGRPGLTSSDWPGPRLESSRTGLDGRRARLTRALSAPPTARNPCVQAKPRRKGSITEPYPSPLNRPQSPCSSQIRSGSAEIPLGSGIPRSASAYHSCGTPGGRPGLRLTQPPGRGAHQLAESTSAGVELRLTRPLPRPPRACEPSVQADPGVAARVWSPIRAPTAAGQARSADPCPSLPSRRGPFGRHASTMEERGVSRFGTDLPSRPGAAQIAATLQNPASVRVLGTGRPGTTRASS